MPLEIIVFFRWMLFCSGQVSTNFTRILQGYFMCAGTTVRHSARETPVKDMGLWGISTKPSRTTKPWAQFWGYTLPFQTGNITYGSHCYLHSMRLFQLMFMIVVPPRRCTKQVINERKFISHSGSISDKRGDFVAKQRQYIVLASYKLL